MELEYLYLSTQMLNWGETYAVEEIDNQIQ